MTYRSLTWLVVALAAAPSCLPASWAPRPPRESGSNQAEMVTPRFVTTNGVRTHFEVRGSGTAVLLIHGGHGDMVTTGVPAPPALPIIFPEDEIRLITYDRRCFGASEYILQEYTLEDLVADARALLDHLDVERAIVIGDSGGGPIALLFAMTYPERTLALGLLETGAALYANALDFGEGGRGKAYSLVKQALRSGDRAVFESRRAELRRGPEWLSAMPPAWQEEYLSALARMSDEDLFVYSTGELRDVGTLVDRDLGPQLHELRLPVCIIHGADDTSVPIEFGRQLHAAISGSELHEVEGGHGLLANPAALEKLAAWVARVAARP